MKTVYLDNNATTSISPEVVDAMMPYLTDIWGNASSVFYSVGQKAETALAELRESVAKSIGAARSNEIYFTASGCEADNWAIKGIAFAHKRKGNHIITTKIEHHAVLGACEFLEKNGFEVTYLDVDKDGFVTPEQVEAAIKDNTILITIMTANNEIGTIEPIKEIAEVAKNHKVIFHTDAVQAIGHMPINVQELGVDMLSLSAHKFHGPKGVGMLYIRNGVRIENLIHGGGQERGKRAATENLAGIAGLAKGLEIAVKNLDSNMAHMKKMRDKLMNGLLERIDYVKLNGPDDERRLCNNVNISYEFVEGESILMRLNMADICASSGSACASGSLDPSHVLMAIGVPHEIAHGSIRFSVGEDTTDEEIDYVLEKMPQIIDRLRAMSPMYEEFEEGKLESFTKNL
ncbi:MAG: cysteine desulfurase NifS [Oscillospiraceae bacterium]|nr:cysteine desulfurase NifS [Oscillospiraceae bacterium]